MAKKLLYLVSEDKYFISHRFNLAKAAIKAGYEVHLATTVSQHAKEIEKAGIRLHPLKSFNRASTNPFNQLTSLHELWQLYKQVKPDVVHHVAMKPVLYGSLVAICLRVPKIVNALTGMGYVFISNSCKAKSLRRIMLPIMRYIFSRPNQHLIVQNKDDYKMWQGHNVVLIRGSGVDVHKFTPITTKNKVPVVLFPSRMLWDKGVGELIAAANLLRDSKFELWFCGDIDPKNPSSVSKKDLEGWQAARLITWLGQQSDMPAIYQKADIVVLPSYREGLPKSLLEAAACGKPMIATDVPGCREIVINKKTGLLVPAHDAKALATALQRLLNNEALRKTMGQAARELVVSEFADEVIIPATLQVYG